MNTHATDLTHDDSTGVEVIRIFRQCFQTHSGVLVCPWPIDTNDAEVQLALDDCQLTKVDVERHENAMLFVCNRENLPITGIFRPFGSGDHVVTGSSQFACKAMR